MNKSTLAVSLGICLASISTTSQTEKSSSPGNKNPSIARVMQSAGYKTAAAGKWQINDFRVQPEAMVSHGFDEYCMWTGYETNNLPSAERYWDPYVHTKTGSKTYKGQFGEDIFSDFLIDGVSLADVILGNTNDSPRKWIMAMGGNGGGSAAHLSEKGLENQYKYRDRVIRNKEYKLFISSERKPEKLVSLSADPEEKTNLLFSSDPKIKSVVHELWESADKFPLMDNDPFYIPLSPEPWDEKITVKSQVWKK